MRPNEATEEIAALTIADYERVVDEYTEHCISLPGVCAIFQFGNVGAPGLSDIDLLVVLDDDARTDEPVLAALSIRHQRWQRNPLVRACFIHDVYVCPRSALANVEYLLPGNTWRLRAGAAEPPPLPSAHERQMIALVHGLDFSVARLRELAELDDLSTCSMRWLVPQLWALTHTRRTLAEAGADVEESWSDVIGALEAMRATPVTTLLSHKVFRLLPPVREHFALAIDHFASILRVRAHLAGTGPKRECSIALHPRRVLYVYDAEGQAHTSAATLMRTFRFARRTVRSRWVQLNLPGELLSHHLTYLAGDPRYEGIAERVAARGRVRAGESGSDPYRRVLARRWSGSLASNRITVGRPLLSGFGVPGVPVPPFGYQAQQGTLKFRAVQSWLDWRLIPSGAIHVRAG